MTLAGKAALVTGAGQGLGLAIARKLLAEGAHLAFCSQDTGRIEAARRELSAALKPGQKLFAARTDVSRPDEVAAFAAAAAAAVGPIDIAVNNAGIIGPLGPAEDVPWDDWARVLQVNLFGAVLVCRHVLAPMRRRGWGKIVNLSGGGAAAPMPRATAYAASKAALVRFTETLAEEARGSGVDVNAVAPGALNTRMFDTMLAAGPEALGAEFHGRLLKQKSDGGAPLADAAALVAFLCSPASDGITGKLLSAVWDPWRELAGRKADLAGGDVYTLRRIVPKDRGLSWGR